MKKKITAIIAAFVTALIPTAFLGCGGCTTTGQPTQATIDATAVLLQGAAQAGAATAIQQDPKNAQYFQLAADSIATFLTATNYTPGAFQTSLMNVVGTNNVVSNPYVQIAIGTVVDLYQLYYGQYVKGQVNGNAYAGEFLTAIQNGFYMALGKPIPTLKMLRGAHPGVVGAYTGSAVLPRPLTKPKK